MDDSRFDAWTRRRFGLATGGALAAALGLAAFEGAGAKRKKRKKRCRKLHQLCRGDGTKPRCCTPMTCSEETTDPELGACCRYIRTACESDNQCCVGLKCRKAVGSPGNRCCFPPGFAGCANDSDCCAGEGVICEEATGTCCRHVQATCAASDECCGDRQCANVAALGAGLRCCAGDLQPCATHNDCCGDMLCASKEGVCV